MSPQDPQRRKTQSFFSPHCSRNHKTQIILMKKGRRRELKSIIHHNTHIYTRGGKSTKVSASHLLFEWAIDTERVKAFNSIQQIINLWKQFSQFLLPLFCIICFVLPACLKEVRMKMKGSIEIAFLFSFSAHAWMPLNGHEFLYLYILLSAAVFHVFMASFSPPLATMFRGNSSSCFMALLLPLKVEIFYHPAFKIFLCYFVSMKKFLLVSKYRISSDKILFAFLKTIWFYKRFLQCFFCFWDNIFKIFIT